MTDLRILGALIIPLLALFSSTALAQDSSQVWVPEILGSQYFAVLVEDVDESADWYRSTFGLDELDRSAAEDDAWEIINLRNDRLSVEIIRDRRAQDVDRALGFFKVGFAVVDVELVADRVERATGERPRVLDFAPHGMRLVQLRDPDDNIIQLSSPLDAKE